MKFYKYILIILFTTIIVLPSCKKVESENKVNKSSDTNKSSKNTVKSVSAKNKNGENKTKKIEFLDKTPKFESINDAVKLRYKFKVGQKVNVVQFLKMSTRYNNSLTFMTTDIYGYYQIKKKLDDGKYELNWVISRIIIELKSKNRKGEEQILKYDSDLKENTMPNVEVFKNLINTSIKAKVDELGNLYDVDLKSFIDSMGGGASEDKLKEEVSQKAEQFMNISFIILPQKDIKTGDTYEGRKGAQKASLLKIESKRVYNVKAVSKDKELVLLKPAVDFEMNTDIEKQKIKIKKNKMTGWILFDVKNGMLKESYTHTRMSLKVNGVDMKMDMKSNFKIIK